MAGSRSHGGSTGRPSLPASRGEALSAITSVSAFCSSAEATRVGPDTGDYERMLHVALHALRRLADGDEAPLRAALRAAETVLRTDDVAAQGLAGSGQHGGSHHKTPAGERRSASGGGAR